MFDYDFEYYNFGVEYLANLIRKEGLHFDYIVGLARGGAVPAVHLSHKLEVPCRILHWQTRDGDARDGLMIREMALDLNDGKSILIVDDIFDTGKTITEVECALLKYADEDKMNIMTAALVSRSTSLRQPDFVHCKDPTGWVRYWWES